MAPLVRSCKRDFAPMPLDTTAIGGLINSLEEARRGCGQDRDTFARQLALEERNALLAEMAVRARRPDGSSASLLRVLLNFAPLRLSAAREAIVLLRTEALAGKPAALCLSELRVAVLCYWGRRQDVLMAAHRLDELLLLSDDIIGTLFGSGTTATAAASAWGSGCTALVKLLPTLLRAADSIHKELISADAGLDGDASSPPSTQLVERLLASPCVPHLALPLLSALEDTRLLPQQLDALRRRLHDLLSGNSLAIRPQLLSIGKHILARIEDPRGEEPRGGAHASSQRGAVRSSRRAGGVASSYGSTTGLADFEYFAAQGRALAAQVDRGQKGASHAGGSNDRGGRRGSRVSSEGGTWCELLLLLAGVIPTAELPELLWLVESALHHSPKLHASLYQHMRAATARIIASSGGSDDEQLSGGARFHATHAARLAVLLLLCRSAQPPALLDALQAHIGALAAAARAVAGAVQQTSNGGPPLTTRPRRQGWACLQQLLHTLVCMPAPATRTEALLDLANHMCESGEALAAAFAAVLDAARTDGDANVPPPRLVATTSRKSGGRSWQGPRAGAALLLALFGNVSESRQAIRRASLMRSLKRMRRRRRARALALLAVRRRGHAVTFAMHAHGAQLINWTSGLPTMPAESARAVLRSLLPLVPLHADFGRHLMLLLRKSLVAPDLRARGFAVHAFCTMLGTSMLADDNSDAQADIVLALRSACHLSPSLQACAYLEMARPLAASLPNEPSAAAMVYEMLLAPLQSLAAEETAQADGSAMAAETMAAVARPFDAAWASLSADECLE